MDPIDSNNKFSTVIPVTMDSCLKWNVLTKKDINILKKYKSVLVFCGDSWEYPYDIVQYGVLYEEEYWHSYMHVNENKYEYSTDEIFSIFSHYILLNEPEVTK